MLRIKKILQKIHSDYQERKKEKENLKVMYWNEYINKYDIEALNSKELNGLYIMFAPVITTKENYDKYAKMFRDWQDDEAYKHFHQQQ